MVKKSINQKFMSTSQIVNIVFDEKKSYIDDIVFVATKRKVQNKPK